MQANTLLGLVLGPMLGLCACAGIEAAKQDNALLRSGFVRLPAAEARPLLAALPPHEVVARDGAYYWADPEACRCVLRGDAAAVAAYRADPRPDRLLAGEEAIQTDRWGYALGSRS